ncbi:hypothetical protein MKW94_009565 [Papaver nudicaule]|uniref:SEC12-like protein 1 n=1 Tax=Papaver nudicaule TaxID=74823 RepID=A0AA41VLN9_PAPNU|nr:hypothetical protein [Papaver nudicaule]
MENRKDHMGKVTCASWIRRPENEQLVVMGKSRHGDSPSVLEIFSYDAKTVSLSDSPQVAYECEDGNIVSVAVHPSGDEIVCSTTTGGCKLLEFQVKEDEDVKILAKDLPSLEGVGPQKCLAFSVDGAKFATGGEDGHLRVFEWPSLRILIDEPKAHKSFRDMDFSLDSEFLASTSADGSARIWNLEDGVPLTSLTRNTDEKIECCRFSKDGTKPFLFCTVQKGNKGVTAVWDISTWERIGYKRLLGKSASVMSVSLDGKYLALGSKDGDMIVVEVKTMGVSHVSRRLHLGTSVASLEFCPSERGVDRVVVSTSTEWGTVVTKLNTKPEWKEWQIYLLLLGLFLASAVLFFMFFRNSDNFWNFPVGPNQPAKPRSGGVYRDSQSDDQSGWGAFGPLDM